MLFSFSYCQAKFKQRFVKGLKSKLPSRLCFCRNATGKLEKTKTFLLSALTGLEIMGPDFIGRHFVETSAHADPRIREFVEDFRRPRSLQITQNHFQKIWKLLILSQSSEKLNFSLSIIRFHHPKPPLRKVFRWTSFPLICRQNGNYRSIKVRQRLKPIGTFVDKTYLLEMELLLDKQLSNIIFVLNNLLWTERKTFSLIFSERCQVDPGLQLESIKHLTLWQKVVDWCILNPSKK